MSNTFGKIFKLTTFGESHGKAVGGIVDGFPDGRFYPGENVTRAQFAAIAVRFAMISPSENTRLFDDVPETHWAYNFINTAADLGWVQGVNDRHYEPERSITRAETVTLVNNMLKRQPDKAYIDSHSNLNGYSSLLLSFADVNELHWAYYNIMEATNTHDYEKFENIEKWKEHYPNYER